MRLRSFLARFRFMGAPGAAVAAVPTDRTGDPAAELAPVLTRLMDVQEEAAEIRARAAEEAAAIMRRAARRAAEMAADAEGRARRAREEAMAAALTEARTEEAALLAAGRSAAERVRRRAGERIPGLADRVAEDALGRLEGGRLDGGRLHGGRLDGEGGTAWAPGGSPE
ncbi:hypothetical protein [Streptomyces sp. NPDC048623]|uniref:hypothetical protein n=1 Tax=Streptomyces sp. NPDC048623 TaxID=3155761 RepID=UPI00343F2F3C